MWVAMEHSLECGTNRDSDDNQCTIYTQSVV